MRGRLIWGMSLIAIGAFFLMQQLGWFGAMQFPFWAFAFALLGVIFLVNFVADRRQWWALDSRLHYAGAGRDDPQ